MESDDIVRLATAANPAEAHVWCQALKDEGISCKVVGEALESGFIDAPGIRPEVWVHRSDLERASAFLEAHRGAGEGTESDEA